MSSLTCSTWRYNTWNEFTTIAERWLAFFDFLWRAKLPRIMPITRVLSSWSCNCVRHAQAQIRKYTRAANRFYFFFQLVASSSVCGIWSGVAHKRVRLCVERIMKLENGVAKENWKSFRRWIRWFFLWVCLLFQLDLSYQFALPLTLRLCLSLPISFSLRRPLPFSPLFPVSLALDRQLEHHWQDISRSMAIRIYRIEIFRCSAQNERKSNKPQLNCVSNSVTTNDNRKKWREIK